MSLKKWCCDCKGRKIWQTSYRYWRFNSRADV